MFPTKTVLIFVTLGGADAQKVLVRSDDLNKCHEEFMFLQPIYVPRAGCPGSSEVTSQPSDTLGREFDPGKRDFSH